MSRFIESLVNDLAKKDMAYINKMKKRDVLIMAEELLKDNYRELTDDTIINLYELQFDTHLVRV
jgi:hypothetical protein